LKEGLKILTSVVPLIFVLMILTSERIQAQVTEIGGGFGVGSYTGDIIRVGDPRQVGLQGTFFGRRNFDNVWSARAGLSFARLNGADAKSPIDQAHLLRDASFSGTLIEVSGVMEYHFLDYLHPNAPYKFTPYGFFGLGYMLFSGSGKSANLGGSQAYQASSVVFPLGMGIKYKLTDQLLMALEFGYRATFSDRLDRIDQMTIVEPKIPSTPSITAPPYIMNQGNNYDKDGYYFLGLTVSYTFKSLKCPTY
jgi:hypothetical protein